MVCATLAFDGGIDNPLSRALPGAIIKPLRELPSLSGCLDWLFAEAAGDDCGRELVLNRLFELIVIQLLRHLMNSRELASGMMAGLAEPRLARALNQLHEKPQHGWSVAELAALAGMSRTFTMWSVRHRPITWWAGASAWRRSACARAGPWH